MTMMRTGLAGLAAAVLALPLAAPREAHAQDFTPAPMLSDFDCAVAYWLRGAMYPMDQAAAGERAQFALGRYQAENAGLSVEEIIGQVQAAGNARYERIMQESRDLEEFRKEMIAEGQNPDEAAFTERLQRRAVEALSFQRDIVACEAKYSFGQAGGQ